MFTKKIRTDGEPNEKEFKSWANVQMVMDNAFTQREKIRKVKEDGTISDVKNFCMSRIPGNLAFIRSGSPVIGEDAESKLCSTCLRPRPTSRIFTAEPWVVRARETRHPHCLVY